MVLHVRGAVLCAHLSRHVVVLLQLVVILQFIAQRGQGTVGKEWFVDRVAGRVDLVDGNVHMQVVGVVVYYADPLVSDEAQPVADAVLDRGERIQAQRLAIAKADDQVVSLVRQRPGVHRLCVEDLQRREFGIIADALADPDAAGSLVLVLGVRQVAHQAGETAFLHRVHRDVLCDDDRRPGFSRCSC